MRIAVDAFGSDACPGPDVEGAVLAARAWGDEIILVGPQELTQQELAQAQYRRFAHPHCPCPGCYNDAGSFARRQE